MTGGGDPLGPLFHGVRDATFPAGGLTGVHRQVTRLRRRRRTALAAAAGCAVLAVAGLVQVIGPAGGTRTLLPADETAATPTVARTLPSVSPPPGFLTLADLGHRDWRVDAGSADRLPATTGAEPVPLPGCSGRPEAGTAPARAVAYRRSLPGRQGEWVLGESVLELDAAQSARVDAAIRTLLTCDGVMWEERGAPTVLLVLSGDRPGDPARPGRAWALTNRTLVVLTLFWAGNDQPAPTFDGPSLTDLVALAVRRHAGG